MTAQNEQEQNRRIGDRVALSDLKARTVRGGALTIGDRGITLILSMLQTIVLARFLTPADFGLVAMVMVFAAFASMFTNLGLSSATIQREQISHEQMSGLFWINVAIGAAILGIFAGLSVPIASFYGKPELQPVVLALSLVFLIRGSGSQHGALLRRQMNFGALTLATASGVGAGVCLSILLAFLGARHWSLVAGHLATAAVTTALLWKGTGWRPGWPKRNRQIGELVRFGMHVTGFNFVNYFSRNADNLLIGRIYGADALGIYSRAYSLMMLPLTRIREPLIAAAMPAMSRLQDRPAQFRTYYRKFTSILAMLTMPALALMAVSAPEVIMVLLGPQWTEASEVFRYLAIAAFLQPVASLGGVVLLSSGQARRYFHWGIVNSAVTVLAFLIGIRWGISGVAIGYCVGTYLLLYPGLWFIFRQSPVGLKDFHAAIWRPSIATAAAVSAALLLRQAMSTDSALFSLVSEWTAGAGVYLSVYLCLPGGWRELASLLDNGASIVPSRWRAWAEVNRTRIFGNLSPGLERRS